MKTIPKTMFLCLLCVVSYAQIPQKTDINTLIGRMPQAPKTTSEAMSNANDLTPKYDTYANEMQALLDKIQEKNPVTKRKMAEGEAMEAKFKRDGVENMSDQEKLAYAKKEGLGGPQVGNNIDFAQKMQDPAFRAKFNAMSPQEKMALMQNQGITKTSTANQSSNPMQADMQAMMQDPAMREKWMKMSPAEKQAFIQNQQKLKGYDTSKRPTGAASNGNLSDDFGDDTNKSTASGDATADAIAQTRNLAKALQDIAITAQNAMKQHENLSQTTDNETRIALEISLKKQNQEGIAQAKSQGKSGQNWLLTNPKVDHDINLNACNKVLNSSQNVLTTIASAWSKNQPQLKALVAVYQASMAKINYGESLFGDDKQFQNLATLTGQQGVIFASLKDIAETLKEAIQKATDAQQKFNNTSSDKPGARILTSDGS